MKTQHKTSTERFESKPVYVLVGPLADPRSLATWAHEEFRKSSTVAFIGVDSGCGPLLESGLPPTLAIGDFDGKVFKTPAALRRLGIPTIELSPNKDRSDLAVALSFCVEQGADVVYAFGFQGGRADHEYAVHLELSEASTKIPRIVSVGGEGAHFYLHARHSPLVLNVDSILALRNAGAPKTRRNPGKNSRSSSFVSVFPVSEPARGVRFRGLRFQPPNGILSLSSQGLSNEIRARKLGFHLRRGRIAIFFPS